MSMYEFTLRAMPLTAGQAQDLERVLPGCSFHNGTRNARIDIICEAGSLAEAIVSAVDAAETVTGVAVTGAGADDGAVSLLDIAQRSGRTRETVRLWANGQRGPGGFPSPAWQAPGGDKFWAWPEVARWVSRHMGLAVQWPPREIEVADAVLKARQQLAAARRIIECDPDGAARKQYTQLLEGW